MRLRTLIGFGLGYVLGAKSDTNRFDDLQQLYQSVSQSPIFQAAVQQARQAAASGVESLTGQQPSWANGGQAQQQTGQAQQGGQGQESEQKQSQESEQSQQKQGQESGQSGNGGGKSKQQEKQQSGQSSS